MEAILSNLPQNKPKRSPWSVILIICLFVFGLHFSTLLLSPDPEKDAWGKIILPEDGTRTQKSVTVVGETQDIPSGSYIWIVVEKEEAGLCQPKKRVLRNSRFRTSVEVTMSEGTYDLSLYVLDETVHNQWNGLQKEARVIGLPTPGENRRLDSVRLMASQKQ